MAHILLCVMWMPNTVGHKRKHKYFRLLAEFITEGKKNISG